MLLETECFGVLNGSGIPWIPWIVLDFFGTGNVIEKILFFSGLL